MKDRVIEILETMHPGVDYEVETGLIDDRILDSFDVVSLVGELMDEFDVQILAEHMTPENFNSAESIAQLIESLED
ncbi:MAG: acyl carrier protein [Lachnospiraceae bacterium]|nr:acyl carrier protein [Lachnospiraceae bacterium]